MKFGIAIFLLLLSGCVSIPLPPMGENSGDYGHIDISVRYRPNFETIMNTFLKEEPKPTSSK
jgi:hypothetical protein